MYNRPRRSAPVPRCGGLEEAEGKADEHDRVDEQQPPKPISRNAIVAHDCVFPAYAVRFLGKAVMMFVIIVDMIHKQHHHGAGEEQQGNIPNRCARCSVNKKNAATAPKPNAANPDADRQNGDRPPAISDFALPSADKTTATPQLRAQIDHKTTALGRSVRVPLRLARSLPQRLQWWVVPPDLQNVCPATRPTPATMSHASVVPPPPTL